MVKRLDIRGIVILVVILCLIQLTLGLFVSPALGSFILGKINENGSIRVTADSINLWPVTLSLSAKNINVAFLDDGEYKKLLTVNKSSVRVSLLALLAKRAALSSVAMGKGELFLETGPDGKFKIEKITEPADKRGVAEKTGPLAFLEGMQKKKDLFSKVYDLLKKRSMAKKEEKTSPVKTTVKANVANLPKGKRVTFVNPWKDYLFSAQNIDIKDVKVYFKADDGRNIDMEKVNINLKDIAFDPLMGAKIGKLRMSGVLRKNNSDAGDIKIAYYSALKKDELVTDVNLRARDIDLEAIGFIYEDSLPVIFKKGILNIDSKTLVSGENIDSTSAISVKEHFLEPKSKGVLSIGTLTTPLICEAINAMENPELKFKISGTLDKPEFKGFQDALQNLIKPYIGNIKEGGISGVKDAIGNIKSLFGSGESK